MAEQAPPIGWASTKPGHTKYHFYQADGASLCSYQRQPGPLHFARPSALQPKQFCEACNHSRHSGVRSRLLLAEAAKQDDGRAFEDGYRQVKYEEAAAKLPSFSAIYDVFYYVGLGATPKGTGYWMNHAVGNYLEEATAKAWARRYYEATRGKRPHSDLDPIGCCRVIRIDDKPPGKRTVVLQLPEQEGGVASV